MKTMLIGQNIKKSFGGNEVLRGVDITVKPGKITVLIGPSGGGKTTLLRSLALLDAPDSGTISIDDTSYKFPLHQGQRITPPWPRLTVVFQQLFLWPHLTLRQNIELPLRKRKMIEGNEHLEKLIEAFDMSHFINRYPNEASLGQRQRVALARALVLEPAYVLLDEITSSLDVEQVSVILSHLQALRDRGIGVLLITHLIGFARRAADQVVFLDDGEVVEDGRPELLDSASHERVQRFLSVIQSAT
jgi:ABC-type polar amino acid transport system ATPase subunit